MGDWTTKFAGGGRRPARPPVRTRREGSLSFSSLFCRRLAAGTPGVGGDGSGGGCRGRAFLSLLRKEPASDDALLGEQVYLDYNGTTPVAAEVLSEMLPYLRADFGACIRGAGGWGTPGGEKKKESFSASLPRDNAETLRLPALP